MDSKELKKVLTRIGLAGLITAGSISFVGCSAKKTSCSSCGAKKAEKTAEDAKTSCSGKTACGGGGTSCG